MHRLAAELNCPMPAGMSTVRHGEKLNWFVVDNAHRSLISARAMHQAQMAAGTQQWDILDGSAMITSSRVMAGLNPFNSNKVHA